jgi:hypothetical protein
MSIWPYAFYFEKNSYKNCVKSLENVLNIGGVDNVVISFINANNYKKCIDSTLPSIDSVGKGTFSDDINKFISSGGNIRISFGSKTGNDIMLDEAIEDENDLYNIYVEIITKFGCYDLDFFIVGKNLYENNDVHQKRLRVLNRLQKIYPHIKICFSIPHYCVRQDIEQLINSDININTINCVFQQNKDEISFYIDEIKRFLTDVSDINTSLGLCFTIGMGCDENGEFMYDNNLFFSLHHAKSIVEFINSINKGEISQISYLYLHRDTFGSADPNMCSLFNVEDFDFYNVFSNIKNQKLKFIETEKNEPLKIENCIFNKYKNDWIVADNIIIGESNEYGYKEIKNKNIDELLKSLEKDDNVCVVNYSLSDGKAYIKTGFDKNNKNNKNDYRFKDGFKCFVKNKKD